MLFDVDRDGDGAAKIKLPPSSAPPTAAQLFRRRCYLNAVTDPDAVARLWAAEKARMADAAAAAKAKAKTRKRAGRGRKP